MSYISEGLSIIRLCITCTIDEKMEILNMYTDLQETERRLRKSCNQILLMNTKLMDLKSRYSKAVQNDQKSFRCVLRTKIVTLEGMINMYYEYTLQKQYKAKDLRRELFGQEMDHYFSESELSGEGLDL